MCQAQFWALLRGYSGQKRQIKSLYSGRMRCGWGVGGIKKRNSNTSMNKAWTDGSHKNKHERWWFIQCYTIIYSGLWFPPTKLVVIRLNVKEDVEEKEFLSPVGGELILCNFSGRLFVMMYQNLKPLTLYSAIPHLGIYPPVTFTHLYKATCIRIRNFK